MIILQIINSGIGITQFTNFFPYYLCEGGCCGSCAFHKGHLDEDESRCGDGATFEKYISLGSEHCTRYARIYVIEMFTRDSLFNYSAELSIIKRKHRLLRN